MKFGIGQPVPRQEDPTLLKGQGRYTDDMNLPNQAYAVMVRSQVAHGVLKGIDTEEAKTMPGVLGVWTGADARRGGLRPAQDPDPGAQPRRLADEDARAPFAGHRQGALRRRSGGLRRRRDPGAGQDAAEAVMLDIDALPAVTDARSGPAWRADRVRRRARQYLRRLLLWRRGGRSLRQGSPRHAPAAGQQPHRRLRHGAALGDRRVRRQERPLHPARRQQECLRPEAPDGRPAEDQAGPDAR